MEEPKLKLAKEHLKKSDKTMRSIVNNTELLTLRKKSPSHFHPLIQTIINQQLSVKAAATIVKRVLDKQGSNIFNAEKLNQLSAEALRQCGLSKNKVRYVKTLSSAVLSKDLNFRSLTTKDDDSIREKLISYPGIGQWSADIFLMAGLGRDDVFPVGDLIIRKSIQHHYSLSKDTEYDTYIKIAESWRPYRTIASYYLWKSFHEL